MSIHYALVVDHPHNFEYILAPGNYKQITASLLDGISSAARQSWVYDNYLFHVLLRDSNVYLALCDADMGTRRPFAFLEAVASYYNSISQQNESSPMLPSVTIEAKMNQLAVFYSTAESDPVASVQAQIDSVKNIMVSNIEKVLSRGERIETLGTLKLMKLNPLGCCRTNLLHSDDAQRY